MKLFNFVTGTVIALAIIAGNMTAITPSAKAQAIDNDPDCDKFSVMWCGSFSNSAIINKYEKGDGHNTAANIDSIYSSFGISKAEVVAGGYVDGVVYQNGEVKVGSKVVATNARTYIRTMGNVSVSKMASAQTAFVKLNKDGQFEYAIMKPCGNPVSAKNVVPPPKPPVPTAVYNCVALSARAINVNTRTYGYTLSYTAKNGAALRDVTYNFGDGKTQTGVKPAAVNTVTHTFAKAGTYTTTTTLYFTVNGKVVSQNCSVKIIAQPDVCPINPSLPKDSPECKPPTIVTPPTVIPNTGAGSVVAMFIGTVLVSAAAYRLWIIRKVNN
jgi:hypothetical protein